RCARARVLRCSRFRRLRNARRAASPNALPVLAFRSAIFFLSRAMSSSSGVFFSPMLSPCHACLKRRTMNAEMMNSEFLAHHSALRRVYRVVSRSVNGDLGEDPRDDLLVDGFCLVFGGHLFRVHCGTRPTAGPPRVSEDVQRAPAGRRGLAAHGAEPRWLTGMPAAS